MVMMAAAIRAAGGHPRRGGRMTRPMWFIMPSSGLIGSAAAPAGFPQGVEGGRAAAGRGDRPPGPPVAVLARLGAADRRHPGAVRYLAGDGPPLRAGRVGALRVLRGAFALVLGAEAVPDHH